MNLYFLQIFDEKKSVHDLKSSKCITLYMSMCVSVVMSKVAHTAAAAVEVAFEVRTKK